MIWLHYLPPLFQGAKITVLLTLYSTVLGGILSFGAGIARAEGGRVISWVAICYIEVFRGTSLLVQLFWLYYALPILGLSLSPITTGVLGLSLNIGAYGAEVVRGALKSVHRTQHEAALALNFTPRDRLLHICLPQAIVEMMPPFGNLAIQNLKDTSLVSLISISDLTFHAQALRNFTLDNIRIYTLTLLGYFIIALGLMVIFRLIERAARRGAAFPRAAHG